MLILDSFTSNLQFWAVATGAGSIIYSLKSN